MRDARALFTAVCPPHFRRPRHRRRRRGGVRTATAMASDAPPLQLSDIMVHLSPSPEILPGDASARSRSPTPDTLNEHDLEDMRRRALEIREILSPSKGKESARENELLRMVLQVTSSAIPLKSQVLSQAETIAQLAQQRQLLLGRIEEERERWDAEREDWSRLSEALVTQTNKLRNGIRVWPLITMASCQL